MEDKKRVDEKDKKRTDEIINIVALIAITGFLIGIMLAIWVGVIGVKIFLSSIVLFVADCIISFLTNRGRSDEREKK